MSRATNNTNVQYVVKWYKSVQRPKLGFQERNCYNDSELKELVSHLRMSGKTYRIIRQSSSNEVDSSREPITTTEG